VLRARAERLASDQQLREAGSAITQARSYVNFLLNRPLDTPLEDASPGDDVGRATDLGEARRTALRERAELAQLDALGRAADAQQRAAQAALGPQLALGVDAGTQGEQYRLGSGYNFIAASLVLSWKFFDGGANRADVAQARIAARDARRQRDDAAQRVELEVQQAVDRLETARDSLATAQAREAAASAAFRIAARKRDEGAISQVEFIDARNALTTAQLNLNVTRFDLIERRAELDHATGSGELPVPRTDLQETLP
jgi:outer membrane protein